MLQIPPLLESIMIYAHPTFFFTKSGNILFVSIETMFSVPHLIPWDLNYLSYYIVPAETSVLQTHQLKEDS
jgi:hypothetical protein